MFSVYWYIIVLLIFCLIVQQLFYIKKKYSQQNTKILDYYLNIKLISKIFETLLHKPEKGLIRKLIAQYYYLEDIIIYQTDKKKFILYDYNPKNISYINENIILFTHKLYQFRPHQIHNIDSTKNLLGIYFFS